MLTYDFRLPPGPRTVEYALLAEDLGFRAVWCPEVPAFGHDIWVTLARIAEKTKGIKFGPSVLIPSYRHPMAQASAIATLERARPYHCVCPIVFVSTFSSLSYCAIGSNQEYSSAKPDSLCSGNCSAGRP